MSTLDTQLIDSGPLLEATGLVHRVLEPAGPGPYRTVVMLHGRFGNEDAMWVFKRTMPATWLKISPRAPQSDPRGGNSWVIQEKGVWPDSAAFESGADAVLHFLEALPRVYNADPDRLYLMGFSQGAAVSYAAALRRPGLIQAIAGLVGFVPEGCEAAAAGGLRDLPVFMAAGTEDRLVPIERAETCAAFLRRAGADLEYHAYETGHRLNAAGMTDLSAWWLRR